MRALLWIFGWLVGPWLRRRAVRQAILEHDAYAHERVTLRHRLGFAPEQRLEAILQRAKRKLYYARVKVNLKHVRKILSEKP